ncbi:hypothetical protein ACFL5L_02510 [candidate division KSB1 bacterium]
MEAVSKSELKKQIFDQFIAGNFSQIDELGKKNSIPVIEMKNIAESAFQQLFKDKNYKLAITVCEEFDLPMEQRIEAIYSQFRLFVRTKEYEKAIDWSIRSKIPESEINSVTVKAFEDALEGRNVERAVNLYREYDIPVAFIDTTALQWFNILFEKKKYVDALLLGEEFDISRKRSLTSGVRGYHQLISNNELKKFVDLESHYNVLGDRDISQIDDYDIKQFVTIFVQNVVKKMLASDKPARLSKLVKSLQIIENRDNNPLLTEIAKQASAEVVLAHNELMKAGRYGDAYELVESFQLLKGFAGPDKKATLIAATENAHHRLIEDGNFKTAKTIKDNYELFEKNILSGSIDKVNEVMLSCLLRVLEDGNIDNARFIIKEYNVPDSLVLDAVSKAVLKQVRDGKYVEAFENVKTFKAPVSSSDLISEAQKAFVEAYEKSQMELASNLGHFFKIKDKRVSNAVYIVWNRHMEAARYADANKFRKTHKLSRKRADPVVKQIYERLLKNGQTGQAQYLRNEYHLSRSIWNLIFEFYKKIFG